MPAAGAVSPRSGLRASALRSLRRRPGLGTEAAVVATWIAMLAILIGESLPDHGQRSLTLWWCMPGIGYEAHVPGHEASVAASVAAGLPMWGLMSITTMLPAALPTVGHVAVNSLRWRRGRAVVEFLAVYLGIWIAFGASTLALLALWPSARTGMTVAVMLALAAAWQLTPAKRRALLACHGSSPLPPRGWRATAGVVRFGRRNGLACLGSCWAMMLVMAVVTTGQVFWTAALTGLISAEKLVRRPRRTTRRASALLAAAAFCAALIAVKI